jgi:hypothetical protein
MVRMGRAEALRDQRLQRPADELVARVTEQRLGMRIGGLDPPVFVHDHAAIGNKLQKAGKLFRCDEFDRPRWTTV